jgi:HEAT repeat protein
MRHHYPFHFVFIVCTIATTTIAQSPKERLSKFPTRDAAEESTLIDELIKQGPDAIRQVCDQIQPPGSTDDTAARFAVTGLVRQAGRFPERRAPVAKAIADSITAADDPGVKAFFINRLQEIGHDESVPALARSLSDEKLTPHPAAALERIATPAAREALAKVVPIATPAARLPVIKSLCALRHQPAAKDIAAFTTSEDATLKETAIWALVNMGSDLAIDPVNTYLKEAAANQKHKALAWMLLGARRQAEAGKSTDAADTAKAILSLTAQLAGDAHTHAAGAALHLLADVAQDAAVPELVKAANSDNIQLRAAALDAAARIPAATHELIKLLDNAQPAVRADIIAHLGRTGAGAINASAFATVIDRLKDPEPPVRLEAAKAAVKLAPDRAIPALVDLVRTALEPEARAVAEILSRIPGDAALAALAAAVPSAPPASKAIILDTLASRVAKAQKQIILAQAAAEEPAVRLAALRAFESVGDQSDVQKLVELALAAKDNNEEQAALKSAIAAGADIASSDQRAAPFLAAAENAKGPKRAALTRALAKVGGPKALQLISADLKSTDNTLKESAIRALGEWTDPAAVTPLLQVASDRSAPMAQQVLALRGVISVTKASQLPSEQKVNTYASALGAARRPDEKKLVLAALAAERSLEALDLVTPLLEDEALKSEAALTTLKIITPQERRQKGLTGEKAIAALKKAIPLSPDPSTRSDAERYLNRISPPRSTGTPPRNAGTPPVNQREK